MERKNYSFLIVLFIIIFLFIGGGIYWWYTNSSQSSTDKASNKNLFKGFSPFGDYNSNTKPKNVDNTPVNNPNTNVSTTTQSGIQPRLRKISDEPVAGASLISQATTTTITIITPIKNLKKDTSTSTSAGYATSTVTTKTVATTTPVIRYAEKATGHIYEVDPTLPTQTRISNTTIPKLTSVLFGAKNYALFRYSKDSGEQEETFLGSIILAPSATTSLGFVSKNIVTSTMATSTATSTTTASTTKNTSSATTTSSSSLPLAKTSEGKIVGSFLGANVYRIAISSSKDRMFYLLRAQAETSGYVANIDGTKAIKIFSTPLKEWLVDFPQTNKIFLTTAPDSSAPGFLYSLDTATQRITKILGDVYGLNAVANNDGSYVLYSVSAPGGIQTRLLRTKDGFDTGEQFSTLAEKCTWSKIDTKIIYCAVPDNIPSATYPESWYRGEVSFTDSVWKINVATGETQKVIDFAKESNGQQADIINISFDEGERYALFINKKDNILWSYRLTEKQNSLN